jgi:hypothetical protein
MQVNFRPSRNALVHYPKQKVCGAILGQTPHPQDLSLTNAEVLRNVSSFRQLNRTFLVFPMHTTYLSHLMFLDFIILIFVVGK